MAKIIFPKIEVEPADLERLENIVKRFEDAIEQINNYRILFARDFGTFRDVMDKAESGDIIIFDHLSPTANLSPSAAPDATDGRKTCENGENGGVGW